MRVLKTSDFSSWATDEGIDDVALAAIVKEMEGGLTGDSLGSSVYKKRMQVQGRGKRGGARTIIAYRARKIAIFMVGFSKNERASISARELEALRRLAKELLGYSDRGWERAVDKGALIEVRYDGEKSKD